MFDRPQIGNQAVLVHIDFHEIGSQEHLEEFKELVTSAGASIVELVCAKRQRPDPRYFIGTGKLDEVKQIACDGQADLVIFNHSLSPAQERNLEQYLECRVLDRTGLILDIFAQRAHTFEGKLQVELAQLRHMSTRLVRGWTHLERQKGGIGLRGPGETQLESDRRMIGDRIKTLNRRLDRVCQQRELRRTARRKSSVQTLSLVGYTNTGKSTLFNQLTGAGVYVADKLFATLDPTLRRLNLPAIGEVILADTVGFVRQLPHGLVAAFRATLEETIEADLLLHVIDAHDDGHHDCIEQVNAVLAEIGADDIPQIEVMNKIDLLDDTEPRVERSEDGRIRRVWLSARKEQGIALLQEAIAECLLYSDTGSAAPVTDAPQRCQLLLSVDAARLRDRLFVWKAVQHETTNEAGEWLMEVTLSSGLMEYLEKEPGCTIISVE